MVGLGGFCVVGEAGGLGEVEGFVFGAADGEEHLAGEFEAAFVFRDDDLLDAEGPEGGEVIDGASADDDMECGVGFAGVGDGEERAVSIGDAEDEELGMVDTGAGEDFRAGGIAPD